MSLLDEYMLENKIESILFSFDILLIRFHDKTELILRNKYKFSHEVQTFIDLIVKDIICNDNDILKLIFDGDKFIEMSLKDEDYEGPEAFELVCPDGTWIVE